MTEYLIPLLMCAISILALSKKQDVYGILTAGAADGLKTVVQIAPALVVLLTAVQMLRASGALDSLSTFLSPIFARVGIPPEVAPLLLIRPVSGSAALAVGADLIAAHGPDSTVGRCAAVILGSTETTFYAISVYFGAAGIDKTRYTVPAALLADFTGFLVACLSVQWFF
ncbi:MAG: spore maturation protein [Ruminococcaceae bacterium]|nr:spore maturation protein [Oscillospiraceae bacterium]